MKLSERNFLHCYSTLLIFIALFSFSTFLYANDSELIWSKSINQFDDFISVGLKSRESQLEMIQSHKTIRNITGEFVFGLNIKDAGWYSIVVDGDITSSEFYLDNDRNENSFNYFYSGSRINKNQVNLGSVWLNVGYHSITISNKVWTGFSDISKISLLRSQELIAIRPNFKKIYKSNYCETYKVKFEEEYINKKELGFIIKDKANHIIKVKGRLSDLPNENGLRTISPYCDSEGNYQIILYDEKSLDIRREILKAEYQVIDTAIQNKLSSTHEPILFYSLNVKDKYPDYFSGGKPEQISQDGLEYIQTGKSGWMEYVRANPDKQAVLPKPSWFSYVLPDLKPQNPYLLEISFPDNDERIFNVVIKEEGAIGYPVSLGVDTSKLYGLSNKNQKIELVFWPISKNPRVVIENIFNEKSAAISQINLFELKLDQVINDKKNTVGKRLFIDWYEEGDNFKYLYGIKDNSTASFQKAVQRWMMICDRFNVNVLSPTISAYSFSFFHSKYDFYFASKPDNDYFKLFLIEAERANKNIIPDIFPRSDILMWSGDAKGHPSRYQLVSRRSEYYTGDPTYQVRYNNPINTFNENWFKNLILEIASRYKDSPALIGLNIRLMQFSNHSLNNFVSLEWGYDDLTFNSFLVEEKISAPKHLLESIESDKNIASKRYDWIMSQYKREWVDWRCKKITNIYANLVKEVKKIRSDLTLYTTVMWQFSRDDEMEELREAGIDIKQLSKISGLEIINSSSSYGRREFKERNNIRLRDRFFNSAKMNAYINIGSKPNFISSAAYFEATDKIFDPQEIGLPKNTHPTWTSSAVSPAGRNLLERYSPTLAETDALILGDGGNMYTLGNESLREFISEFTKLPSLRFSRLTIQGSDVAVWQRKDAGDYYFYLVNRTNNSKEISIQFDGSGNVTRLLNDEVIKVVDGKLNLQLAPYQLIGFSVNGNLNLSKIGSQL